MEEVRAEVDEEVGGERFQPDLRDDDCVCGGGCGVVGLDHGARPGSFAGRVDIVRAGDGAGGEDRGAVEVVGADCVDYEGGGCAEAGEGGGGEVEGFDVWLFAVWV